jgi:hypothetical protein
METFSVPLFLKPEDRRLRAFYEAAVPCQVDSPNHILYVVFFSQSTRPVMLTTRSFVDVR